jgi:hypothetical protein
VTAEGFWTGVLLGTANTICCVELGRARAVLSAVRVRVRVPQYRPSSLPAFREAMKARKGGWGR